MKTDPYSIPEQIRRYSIDITPFYPSQSVPFPNYAVQNSLDYFSQEISPNRSRILSFSDSKKKKGDLMDFYVKYKTEVIM